MAKFWENLQYHEDTVEKHKITKEEIEFLKNLQKEMNTQDHVGQAAPRYWVIRDYDKVLGEKLDNPDGLVVYIDHERCVNIKYKIFQDDDYVIGKVKDFLKENSYDFFENDFDDIFDIDDLREWMSEEVPESRIVEYEIIIKYSGFFLTQKAAEEHLRANYYHYSDEATTYAMTAWRSEEADMLYKILHSVDFSKLKEEGYES